jgi:hypothetical protein
MSHGTSLCGVCCADNLWRIQLLLMECNFDARPRLGRLATCRITPVSAECVVLTFEDSVAAFCWQL